MLHHAHDNRRDIEQRRNVSGSRRRWSSTGQRDRLWNLLLIFLGLFALAIYGALRFKKWMIWPSLILYILIFIPHFVYIGPFSAFFMCLFISPNAMLVYLISNDGSDESHVDAAASVAVERDVELAQGAPLGRFDYTVVHQGTTL